MKLLLQAAKIYDLQSPFHLQTKDIQIENGLITKIEEANSLNAKEFETVIQSNQLCVSPGWIDINTENTDPGFEHRDTLQTLANTASLGGFTRVGLMPSSEPAADHRGAIEQLLHAGNSMPVTYMPIGAVTIDRSGKEMAELFDMHQAGAVGFSDGNSSNISKPVIKRALQYTKAFNGLILHHAEEASLTESGLVHEGAVSIEMGLIGRPAIAEELGILNAIYLTEYTGGRMHLLNISTKGGVELIKEAKKKKLPITASVNAINLYYTEQDVIDFDTNFKVNPPLRGEQDRQALIHGVLDGTLDIISSGHVSLDEEVKKLEFDLASFGMWNLPFTFQYILEAFKNVPIEQWIDSISSKPRSLLSIENAIIDIQKEAEISIFDPSLASSLSEKNNPSKSSNSSAFNKNMTGKVIGTIHKKRVNSIL